MSIKMDDTLTPNVVEEEARKETKPTMQSVKEIADEALANLVERTPPIQALQQRIAQAPVVDKQKVESLQNKLANNALEINPDKIAEKILNLEDDLFSEES